MDRIGMACLGLDWIGGERRGLRRSGPAGKGAVWRGKARHGTEEKI